MHEYEAGGYQGGLGGVQVENAANFCLFHQFAD